jgi:flagellum-specific peptidoglycan hydrolase FlgJ
MGDDSMRDEGTRTDATTEGSTTAVDDAFVKVPGSQDAENAPSAPTSANDAREELLDRDRAASFRRRWDEIQTDFVDRPRDSVEQADRLVLEVMQQLQASFTLARERLESQWSQGGDASTEDLRQSLRRYRSFFDRLLNA